MNLAPTTKEPSSQLGWNLQKYVSQSNKKKNHKTRYNLQEPSESRKNNSNLLEHFEFTKFLCILAENSLQMK